MVLKAEKRVSAFECPVVQLRHSTVFLHDAPQPRAPGHSLKYTANQSAANNAVTAHHQSHDNSTAPFLPQHTSYAKREKGQGEFPPCNSSSPKFKILFYIVSKIARQDERVDPDGCGGGLNAPMAQPWHSPCLLATHCTHGVDRYSCRCASLSQFGSIPPPITVAPTVRQSYNNVTARFPSQPIHERAPIASLL